MATSTIKTDYSVEQFIDNRYFLIRMGRLRILVLSQITGAQMRAITLDAADCPPKQIFSSGVKYAAAGTWGGMAMITVTTAGTVGSNVWASYNSNTSGVVDLGNADQIDGVVVWSV